MQIYVEELEITLAHRNVDFLLNIESIDYCPGYNGYNCAEPSYAAEAEIVEGYLEVIAVNPSKVSDDINRQLKESRRMWKFLVLDNEKYIEKQIITEIEVRNDY